MAFTGDYAWTQQPVSLSMRDVEIAEVMEMLSMQNRTSILLAEGVEGMVSFNLFDVDLDDAIHSIANAAGFVVEQRGDAYFVVSPEDAGLYGDSDFIQLRTFDIEYADASVIEESLGPFLSNFGSVSVLPERRLVMVQDQPAFLARIERMIRDLDRRPEQILIEAKILEITLADEDAYGIDWVRFFTSDDGTGSFGTQGLSGPGPSQSNGFFFDYLTSDYEIRLNALQVRGRLRTLSTPKLLAIENQEASVIIGDRRGYQVTTTINQVTSESIEFLESGVILRVTPSVDAEGRIMLEVHPEVSNGTVDTNGVPSQTTTELTTRLLVPNGQTVFLGGLIKHAASEDQQRVPGLGRVPGLRKVFGNQQETNINTETIILITPRIVDAVVEDYSARQTHFVREVEEALSNEAARIDADVFEVFGEIEEDD